MTSTALTSPQATAIENGWASHVLTFGLAVLAVIALFIRDWTDMARMWWDVSTYQHCLFIVPIIGWLVVQRRHELKGFMPKAWWPGMLAVFGASCVWMLGEAGGIALFRHAGLIFLVQALVLALLGPKLFRALLFPVFYLVFLIPAGEELVPALQTITARITIWLMSISNIPHQVNGVLITIPNGYFEVAEECSGVKFLIAMIAYGTLVANVCFRSWARRGAFLAACVIVPILANGVRAFLTIWMAWVVDRDFAKGFDHVVYGWFFFAIVLALLMAMGWRFFDRRIDDPWIEELKPDSNTAHANPLKLGFAALAALAMPVAWQAAIAATGQVPLPKRIALPAVDGWARTNFEHRAPWAPHFAGADHMLHGSYRAPSGDVVDFAVAVFAWQAEKREIVGYGQGAIGPESHWAWAAQSASPRVGMAERIAAPGPVSREVVSIYITQGKVTGSAATVKLETLKSRLLGGDQAAVALLVSAEEHEGRPARAAVDRFLTAMGDPETLAHSLVAQAR